MYRTPTVVSLTNIVEICRNWSELRIRTIQQLPLKSFLINLAYFNIMSTSIMIRWQLESQWITVPDCAQVNLVFHSVITSCPSIGFRMFISYMYMYTYPSMSISLHPIIYSLRTNAVPHLMDSTYRHTHTHTHTTYAYIYIILTIIVTLRILIHIFIYTDMSYIQKLYWIRCIIIYI